MRQLLFAFIFLFTISIVSCSDNGTGPNNEETTTYSVAVDVTPSEAGSISPSSEDTYDEGEEVELQADANEEYLFTHWSGDIDSISDNPLSLTVDQDYNLTANFELKTYELSVNTEGEGSVNEEVLEQKSKDYEHGTVVQLTANPSEGYQFVEWQGDVTGSENPAHITVNDPKEVTAIFEKKTYTLSVKTSGEGSISITPDQPEYEFGAEVELSASASGDWEFDKWQGDLSGNANPETITIDSDKSIETIFKNTAFAGGYGTKDNPYKVSTVEELQSIQNYLGSYFTQINDIDAGSTINWNSGKGFNPIGDEDNIFRGYYDGNGFIIENLHINRSNESRVGLFGRTYNSINPGGEIKNLGLQGVKITGGNITGGLVAENSGEITNCFVTGEVNGLEGTGGLVGTTVQYSVIRNSFTEGVVNGTNFVGGLLGKNAGTVSKSKSLSEVNGEYTVGGLIGRHTSLSGDEARVTASYALGNVTGINTVGGLIGDMSEDEEVEQTYATGNVDSDGTSGGLIGSVNNTVDLSSSYWDTESTSQNHAIDGGGTNATGLVTSEMTGSSAEENMPNFNWDEYWIITNNYPSLSWE
ncbi:InlB B-repeat-containing protein [Fodinibius sp. SL11]|uniref:InlB B-repeat-containing protein n=1 Tax=Fodinibius sp. SL11 TaxID=3425690 RepID=UPI003F881933